MSWKNKGIKLWPLGREKKVSAKWKKKVRGLEWRENEWREEIKGEKRKVNKKSWETL
jgi:hypothetical protein